MFDWTSRLLHWRQGNEVITQGKQTQFIPHNGVYVIDSQSMVKNVMTILNGRNSANKLEVKRYAEIIGKQTTARDVTTGKTISLSTDVPLSARQAMVLEF